MKSPEAQILHFCCLLLATMAFSLALFKGTPPYSCLVVPISGWLIGRLLRIALFR